MSIDPGVVGLNFPTELGLVADARTFLETVLDAAERMEVIASAAATVHSTNLALERAAWRDVRADLASHDGMDGGPMRPEAIMAVLDAQIADDAVSSPTPATPRPGPVPSPRHAGRTELRSRRRVLGWAFPAALGAQLAAPDKQVICITGDGGFGYHIGDIETAIRIGLPIVVIVLNNQTLAFEEHVQELLYGKVVHEVNYFHDVDYGKIASAFGANGFRVTNADGFGRALARD